jgi:hypothetical protein
VYEKGFDEIIEVLRVYKNPSGYIVVLPYIYERSDKLKAIVDKKDINLLEKLAVEYKASQDREKVVSRETKLVDETNYIQHYKDLFAVEEDYNKTNYGSQKHLISLMYSKGLLDDTGKPLIVPRNYWWDVELITNDKAIKTKIKTEGNGYNYYNVNTGKMFIQSYKTAPGYGAIDITLSNYTQKVILKSYALKERKWLFETGEGKYANNSSFNNSISQTLGITVNQIRRSFVNYYLFVEKMPRDIVARLARHSVEVNELTYTTAQSNIAKQNTIYDVNVINKKVNVKIKPPSKKQGQIIVGVVTRSLLPNRDEFPYSIVFEARHKLKPEQATTIPDSDDGITMFVEKSKKKKKGKGRNNRR